MCGKSKLEDRANGRKSDRDPASASVEKGSDMFEYNHAHKHGLNHHGNDIKSVHRYR